MRSYLLGIALLAVMPSLVTADNAIKPGKVELYPTHAAVGIEAPYSDDDNGNAQASFVWRKAGEKNWRNGVDMTIDRERKLVWASIWPLEQGETIEVQISFADPDFKDKEVAPWTGVVTTRRFSFTPKNGRVLHVSPTGNDANPGAKDKPFRTLAHAGKQLKPGDTLQVHDGTYAEGDLFSRLQGTNEQPVVIMAAPGAKPVLDSSTVIAKKSGAWKSLGDGVFVAKAEMNTQPSGYIAQDGRRMFPHSSLNELKADKAKVNRAWYYDDKTRQLYVRTGLDAEPDAHTYHLSQHAYGFHLTKAQHVVIRGLTMRHYGAVAVRLSEGAAGCVLSDNAIHNCTGAVFLKSDTTRDNAVWNNTIYDVGAADFTWEAHYSIAYPNQAIYCDKAGRGNSFCHNNIHGYFDLISVESWKNPDKLQYNRDCDIFFNQLADATDDAIEVDGGGVNMRIHGNQIHRCRTAISLAPVERGPVYVLRNLASFFGLFIKFNVGGTVSHGWTYIYHNTAYSLVRGEDGGTGISFAPNLPCTNKVIKNNIIIVNEWCVRAWRKDNVLDYDCYYHIPNRAPRRFQGEKKVFNTIADFAKGTGQEKHGLYADPMFLVADDIGVYEASNAPLTARPKMPNLRPRDLRLQPGSPCIDRGVILRGINDDYRGKSPDIGAVEFEK